MAPLYLLLTLSGFLQPADTVDISRPVAVIFEGDTVVLEEDRFNWDSLARVYLKPMLEAGCAFASIQIENSLLRDDTLFLTTVVDSGQMVGVASLAFHGTHYTRPGLLSRLSGFMPFIFSLDRIAELAVNLEGKNCSVLDWEVVLIPNAKPVPVWETYNESRDSLDSIQPVILNLLVSEDRIPSRVQAAAGYADDEGFTGQADILIANPFGGRREIEFTWRRFQFHDLSYS
ncbi:hypothetical protein GF359_08335, partial [candidate division WOR-3 bacterium]|nr:hypothetical protein [candidate division WOR-3 bacterium]MBD3365208.1 hypothetical protein [candidate division WOR-3 bacterium]